MMRDLIAAAGELVEQPKDIPVWAWLLGLLIVVGVPGVVSLLVQHPIRRQVKGIAADTRESRDQVANTHSTNLRDDVDQVIALVREAVEQGRQTRLDIGGLREELRQERRERHDGDAALARRTEEFGVTLSKHLHDRPPPA